MKVFLLFALITIAGINLKAQTVNDVPLKDFNEEFIQIYGSPKIRNSKINLQIDYGQRMKNFNPEKQTELKDDEGKTMEFSSMMEALNFMHKNGYEYVDSYTATLNNVSALYYLLRKKKSKTNNQTHSEEQ